MSRTLVLMRHSKSSWSTPELDHERPLSARGRRDGTAAGAWLVDNGLVPDLALVSTATRTRQTLEQLELAGLEPRRTEFATGLYEADAEALVDMVQLTSEKISTLLVIGHNAAVQQAVDLVARRRGNHEWWRSMDEKYPTSAIAVIDLDGPWASIGRGYGSLRAYQVPRGHKVSIGTSPA